MTVFLLHDFGGHPARTSTYGVIFLSFLHLCRHAEVRKKYFSLHIQKYVTTFDVTMNFSVLVQVAQPMHCLSYNRRYDRFIRNTVNLGLLSQHVHDVCAGARIHNLHHNP